MSVDFNQIPAESFEFNRKVLRTMKQHADAGDTIIQYGGGFTIRNAYERWQDNNCQGQLIIFKTNIGVELAQYVETWLNINASAVLNQFGEGSAEFEGTMAQLRFIGVTACQALSNENAAETYQLWKDHNLNTPATITEEELRLTYAAEVLHELWDAQHETRTLH